MTIKALPVLFRSGAGLTLLFFSFVLQILLMLLFVTTSFAFAAVSYPLHIIDDASGGDCQVIGTWNSATKTCKLNLDIYSYYYSDPYNLPAPGISVDSDGITIDGNGHRIQMPQDPAGYWYTPGIVSSGKNNITLENLYLENCFIQIDSSTGTSIRSSTFVFTGETSFGAISVSNFRNGIIESNVFTGTNQASVYEAIDAVGMQGSVIQKNTLTAFLQSIFLGYSTENTIRWNSFSYNGSAIMLPDAFGNQVYNNNFIMNALDINGYTTDQNIFNLGIPIGGNFFDRYDELAEGCNDLDTNGFCDEPYILSNDWDTKIGQDNLPWTVAGGWCADPQLDLSRGNVYWTSYADYLSRRLSVEFVITTGSEAANVRIVATTNTNGVGTATQLPELVGNISAGGNSTATLKYDIPAGAGLFMTQIYATGENVCGASFSYPGPYFG
ncbi:MAG: NosD domain-containing protein [Thermoleophilia bacterium]